MGFELEVAGWGIAFFPGEVLAPLMFLALIAALLSGWNGPAGGPGGAEGDAGGSVGSRCGGDGLSVALDELGAR